MDGMRVASIELHWLVDKALPSDESISCTDILKSPLAVYCHDKNYGIHEQKSGHR